MSTTTSIGAPHPTPEAVDTSFTEDSGWFEDFTVGQRWRHARGATIDEVENQLISKLVMNTAQEHWNEHSMADSSWGKSRIVFGLITASLTIGLASQDTAENAVREVRLDGIRLKSSVFHGDTIYAYTEVLNTALSNEEGAGLVTFQHWGVTDKGRVVFECQRTVLIKRRTAWRR